MTDNNRPNPFSCTACGGEATRRYYELDGSHIESYCEGCPTPKATIERYFKDEINMVRKVNEL